MPTLRFSTSIQNHAKPQRFTCQAAPIEASEDVHAIGRRTPHRGMMLPRGWWGANREELLPPIGLGAAEKFLETVVVVVVTCYMLSYVVMSHFDPQAAKVNSCIFFFFTFFAGVPALG